MFDTDVAKDGHILHADSLAVAVLNNLKRDVLEVADESQLVRAAVNRDESNTTYYLDTFHG